MAALVFGGGPDQLYQATEWLWPLERLSAHWTAEGLGERPVVVLCRDPLAAEALSGRTSLPVRWARRTQDALAFLSLPSLRIAFYPNQNTLNFQTLAARGPAHIHLSHGESEKASMTSNQLKAYDEVFAAGEAARDRITVDLIGFEGRITEVGRPQLDAPREVPAGFRPSGRRTVLYAPTWEGDRPAMSYSSVAVAGERLVEELVTAGRRVIYRPHPQIGRSSVEHRRADRRIARMLQEAGADHVVDSSPEFGWQWAVVDEAVLDMSAVAFEALTVAKPFVVIAPAPAAVVRPDGLLSTAVVAEPGRRSVVEALETAAEPARASARAIAARHYFGDTAAGAQIARFIRASDSARTVRDEALRRRAPGPEQGAQ